MRTKIDQIIRIVLVCLMGLLVLDVIWQVFTRYVLQSPSTFTDELARYLLIWISFLGAAYYSGQQAHIAIDILSRKLSSARRIMLENLIRLLIIVFAFCVLVVGGGHLMYLTWHFRQITPSLQIPIALVYLVGPLSGLLIIYYALSDILHSYRKEQATKTPPN